MKIPIRILHVLGRLDRGGAETFVMNLYRNIDRSKIQFDFMIHTDEKCDYNNEITSLGGKIYSIPRYTGTNHRKYINAWNEFLYNHSEYKIIHGHLRSTASIYLSIGKKFGLKTIAHSHSTNSRGNTIEKLIKNIYQIPIRYIADYKFACSNEAGKWLFGKSVEKSSNYKIIKNAINVEEFRYNENLRINMRKKLDINDQIVIGHVGSFTYPKNHDFILDVFNEILEKEKSAALLLIGDGELKAKIKNKVNRLGMEDKVIFTGNVYNVNHYLQAMDVFVFPSLFEGLGIAVIEAQASGLPCIISDKIPKEAEVIELVNKLPIKSPKQWANKIMDLVSLDVNTEKRRDVYKTLIINGYDINHLAKKVQNMYFQILRS